MISFIIPAYNEEKYIQCCIFAIQCACKALDCKHEIIVVDDQSSDLTRACALKLGVKVLTKKIRHLGEVRNHGAREARGDYLVFVDADTLVLESALEEMLNQKDSYEAGSTIGKYYDLNKYPLQKKTMNMYAWFCRYIWRTANGYFMWCNREKFVEFNPDYYLFEDVWFKNNYNSFYLGHKKVLTSGRKAITHNFLLSLIPFMLKYVLFGNKIIKSKKHLGMWYDGKR